MVDPADSITAHINFDPHELGPARDLGEDVRARFGVPMGHLHVAPAGLHPRGCCQMTVPPDSPGRSFRPGAFLFSEP